MNRDCKTERDRLHMRISRTGRQRNRMCLQHYLPITPTLPHVLQPSNPLHHHQGHLQDGDELAMPIWLPSEGK